MMAERFKEREEEVEIKPAKGEVGGVDAPNMWRQLYPAKQQSMTQQKLPTILDVTRTEALTVMCSEAAALFGCCWPQTVSALKNFRCIPLFSFF